MPALTRRGTAVNAGRKCPFKRNSHACVYYGRYEIGFVHGETLESVTIACGAHVADAIRSIWRDCNTAAVVREVPGMWRDSSE